MNINLTQAEKDYLAVFLFLERFIVSKNLENQSQILALLEEAKKELSGG